MPKRTNEQWLSDLRAAGSQRETALVDLRAEILYGLPCTLRDWLSPDDPRFVALAEEVAQETLMRVLDHLDSFEDRSQFTTWVHKIAVRVALYKLLHDARVRLKRRLAREGLTPAEMLVVFERGKTSGG